MKHLNRFPIVVTISLLICIGFVACNTTQQRRSFNTLASTEATATAAVDGYYLAAAKGLADTNGIPKVTKAYNEFQGVMQVAVLLANNNSNALSSSNVLQELSAVVSAVAEFSTPPKKRIGDGDSFNVDRPKIMTIPADIQPKP
jgi:hypothetical protein